MLRPIPWVLGFLTCGESQRRLMVLVRVGGYNDGKRELGRVVTDIERGGE
jgi:hypothetical protein